MTTLVEYLEIGDDVPKFGAPTYQTFQYDMTSHRTQPTLVTFDKQEMSVGRYHQSLNSYSHLGIHVSPTE